MTEVRRGELFSITGTLLWSLFPVITILSFNHLSPFVSLAFGTLLAAVFFSLVLTLRRKWPEVRNSEALKDMIIGASIIGVVFYILFFFGLKFTSAGNASIIAKTEIFFSFLFFHVCQVGGRGSWIVCSNCFAWGTNQRRRFAAVVACALD